MAGQYLGETFDIHGGGIDLMFPHHENEIAQSEGAHHNHPLANVWMHNGFLQVEGEKMSKSAGNFFTIRDLLADWPGEVLRFNMLRTHYRQPIDWTINGLKESETILNKWRRSIRSAGVATNITPPLDAVAALYDDLNTPLAIKLMHHYARTAHGVFFGGGPAPDAPPQGFRQKGAGKLIAVGDLIGIDLRTKIENSNAEIEAAIAARKAARAAKDFAMSDRIRDELLARGIVLKDGPDGTTWEVKR
jgi:cysteinyl-tRNA synthetase